MNAFRAPLGMLLVWGLVAGILAYTISSRRAAREATAQQMLVERARELSEADLARAGQQYISKKLIPEVKPVLIDVLKDAESYVDSYFRKAEKAIQEM